MPEAGCRTCGAPRAEHTLLCHYCGTAYRDLVSLDEQRAALAELHEAMATAAVEAEKKGEPLELVRERFLQNGFLPRDPDLLIEEALRCQLLFLDEMAASTAAPRARYEACLTRLELQAVDDASLEPKVAILARQLDRHRKTVRKNNLAMVLFFFCFVAGAVALGVWIIRAVFEP